MTQTEHDEAVHRRTTHARQGGRPDDPDVLIREARRRQRRRYVVIGTLVALAMTGAGLGLWLSGGGQGTPPPAESPRTVTPLTSPPTSEPVTAPPIVPKLGLDRPEALAIANNGDLLIANQWTNQIVRLLPNGTLSVVAGTGTPGYSGDGGLATQAELNSPSGIAVSASGTIYVADTNNNRIRAISPTGTISTVAGDGSSHTSAGQIGVGPFGVPAVDATLDDPISVALGPDGQLYVADGFGIQQISPGGILSSFPVPPELSYFGASAIAADRAGDLYVALFSPKTLVELSPAGSELNSWNVYVTGAGLAVAPDGSILIADYGRFSVDRISNGQLAPITTFSFDSVPGVTGVFRPSGISVTSTGTIYVDTDGANGGTNTPALGTIGSLDRFELMATGANTYPQG